MPYDVSDGSILEVIVKGRLNAQEVMVVRHYKWNNQAFPGDPADGPGLISLFAPIFGGAGGAIDAIATAMGSAVTGLQGFYQWISPTRFAYEVYVPNLTEGQEAGVTEPPGVSAAIVLQADTTGPHSRGVVHMPGVPAAFVSGGLINADGLTAYQSVGEKLSSEMEVGPDDDLFTPVIYNRATPAFSSVITHYTVKDTVRTMRRRVVGRGA